MVGCVAVDSVRCAVLDDGTVGRPQEPDVVAAIDIHAAEHQPRGYRTAVGIGIDRITPHRVARQVLVDRVDKHVLHGDVAGRAPARDDDVLILVVMRDLESIGGPVEPVRFVAQATVQHVVAAAEAQRRIESGLGRAVTRLPTCVGAVIARSRFLHGDDEGSGLSVVERTSRIVTTGDIVGVPAHERRRQRRVSVGPVVPVAHAGGTGANVVIGRDGHLRGRQKGEPTQS